MHTPDDTDLPGDPEGDDWMPALDPDVDAALTPPDIYDDDD